jgi:tight adherence protein C
MFFIVLGICLFIGFVFLILLLVPQRSAAGALLDAATRPVRVSQAARWRTALDVDYLAKPFTLLRSLFSREPDPKLVRRMALAGYRKPAHADMFLGARLAVPAVLGLLATALGGNGVVFYFLLAVAVGFFAPDFWLTWAINNRRDKIRLSLPDGLDFLSISLEAGLGLDQGIVRLGQELQISHPELSEELLQINFEQRAGIPRIAAWRSFSDRVDLESVRSFVGMLVQTDRFGTPISKALANFSDALRTERRQKAEEMAAKTSIKLLFPLALFIAPAMGIVLLGPAAISMMKYFQTFLKH